MTQSDFGQIDPATKSGTGLAFDLNNWRDALHSLHAGAQRPTYAQPGLLWLDNSAWPWAVKMYTGFTDLVIFQITQAGALMFPPVFREDVRVRKAQPAFELQGEAGGTLARFYTTTAGFAALRVIDAANPANSRDLQLGYAGATMSWAGNKVWHEGNDGPGSGLEADLLDGFHASAFVRAEVQNTFGAAQRFIGGIDYMYTAAQPYVRGWRSLPDYAAHFNVNLQTDTFRLYDNGNAWFASGGFTSGMVTNLRKVTQAYQGGNTGSVYHAPNGAVITGIWFGAAPAGAAGFTINGFYYKYLQGYTAGGGWFTFQEV